MNATVERSIDALHEPWEDLAERASAEPWLRPGWIDAWWRAFGRGRLELLCVRRDGELVAVLPLERRRGALAATANWHSPMFSPLAVDEDALAHLMGALFRAPRTAMISLRPVPSGEGADAAIRQAAREAGHRLLEHVQLRSPYVSLEGTIEEFRERGRPSRSVLKEIRRCRRRLESEGELTFEVRDGSERLEALLAECFEVEAAGWQGAEGSAMSSRPQTRDFYADVARWAADRGWLRLIFLRLDGRAIAAELCLEQGGVLFDLKGGYRQEYRKQGPGKIIALETIEWAYAQGLRGFDFVGSDDPYKLQWTDVVRERSILRAFAPTPAGAAAWATWAHARPLATRALAAARGIELPGSSRRSG